MKLNLIKIGQGAPVVFFHGWGFDHRIWLSISPDLVNNYELILVDLPGFGASSLMEWSTFKKDLLQQLPEQFSVVGWSLGGLFAQRLAIEEPSRLSSLICIGSLPCFVAEESWPAVPKKVFDNFYKNLVNNAEITLNEFINLQLNQIKVPIQQGATPSKEGLEQGLRILQKWDFRSRLSTLKFPIHFIFGRLDPIAPVRMMRVMELLYPHFSYLMFKRSAHMPFLSQAELFIEELKRRIQ